MIPKMQTRLPDVEIQRGILTKRRDEYLGLAFSADAEFEGLSVQDPTASGDEGWKGEEAKRESLANLRIFSANCRKSAAKMDEMIDKLPKPANLAPFLQ